MEKVLALIEKKKQEFAKSELFEFMRDKSIDPRQRLAFAPCIAPFTMGFGDREHNLIWRKSQKNLIDITII